MKQFIPGDLITWVDVPIEHRLQTRQLSAERVGVVFSISCKRPDDIFGDELRVMANDGTMWTVPAAWCRSLNEEGNGEQGAEKCQETPPEAG